MTCHSTFTVEHANICNIGATTIQRHNHVRNIIASYAEKAFGASSTSLEPTLGSLDDPSKQSIIGNSNEQARDDVCIRSIFTPQIDSFLYIAIISPTCESNVVGSSVSKNIKAKETQKRNLYQDRIQKRLAGEFYPFVCSSGGMIGEMAKKTIDKIATKLSCKTDEDSKKTNLMLKAGMSFFLLRSRINAIRNPKRSIYEQLLHANS